MIYLFKLIVSAVIILLVSEVSKRSGMLGGLIASLPLTSILAILWLYRDTQNEEKVIELSWGIFWMVIPSLVFFVVLPLLLKKHISFAIALPTSMLITATAYYLANLIYAKLGIQA